MLAIRYIKSVPRYLLIRLLGRYAPGLYTSGLAPVTLASVDPPEIPTAHWVRVAPSLTGICGSDLATIRAQGSAYFSGLTSTPFVLGHEIVGVVRQCGEDVSKVVPGSRVVLQHVLDCQVREIDPPCAACAQGHGGRCVNVTRGVVGPGIQTGYCRDTGGGWSRELVAHESQLYRVSAAIPDEVAVLTEPFACALHAVLRAGLRDEERVFVIGCGSMGLLTIAALRATGFQGRLLAVARHPHQQEQAVALGADLILASPRSTVARYGAWSKALNAECHRAALGKPAVLGGVEVTFDCVASSQSLDDAMRFTAAGGRMILVGMPAIPRGVDWTPLWHKEVSVIPSYAYGVEEIEGRRVDTFELALKQLAGEWGEKLKPLVGRPYTLRDYREAFRTAMSPGRSRSIKTVFRIAAAGRSSVHLATRS